MRIFEMSKVFPREENFSLTSQIRRSSRGVCSNLAEAYRKRQYPAHFVSKISDADAENTESQVWFDFALHCNYIDIELFNSLVKDSEEIGKLLHHMLTNPEKY